VDSSAEDELNIEIQNTEEIWVTYQPLIIQEEGSGVQTLKFSASFKITSLVTGFSGTSAGEVVLER